MSVAIPAIYEDGVFRPLSKIDIPNHQKVLLTVQPEAAPGTRVRRWHWQEARAIDDRYDGEISGEVVRQRRES